MVVACFLLAGGVVSAQTPMDGFRERVRGIYGKCRQMDDSRPEADLEKLAKAEGLSKEEMAGLLTQLVSEGLDDNASANQRYLADCALWGLVRFAGEKEFIFVRNLMRTTKDVKGIRRTAIIVDPRMAPDKWEEWLREVVADERSDHYDRFLVWTVVRWIRLVRISRSMSMPTARPRPTIRLMMTTMCCRKYEAVWNCG